jgi:hypothetical protein
MSSLKPEFIQYLSSQFPGLKSEPLENLISDNLLSPHKVTLPKKLLEQGQAAIRGLFELRESPDYQKMLEAQKDALGLIDPGNKAIMMSYDFHVDEFGNLKLIEVNTNAAFLVLGQILYDVRKLKSPVPDFNLLEIKKCIHEELKLQGKESGRPAVVVMDDNPQAQRLYIEFLVCRELFRSWDWPCEIKDVTEALKERPEFIYNRYTDFYFLDPGSARLRSAYLNGDVCFSPHPYEYFLLADKRRMIEWSKLSLSPDVEKVLLKSWLLNSETKEDLWGKRKGLFFKPSHEFGSKGSFKGGSISRKAFDELAEKDALAQEYVPAPEMTFETITGPQTYKCDLRFYSYKGRLQTVMARLYQGQTTNLRTAGGGFACVEFI